MPPEGVAGVIEQPSIGDGPATHPELAVEEVRRLALRGVGTLLLRSISQRMLMVVGNVLLARLLAPETFGVYAIVSFVVGMAGFLADLGMGASLIQRKEPPTEADLRTAFTLSFALNCVVTTVIMLAAPHVMTVWYHLDGSHVAAVRMMALAVLLSTFTAIPTIRLERALQFQRLAIADLLTQLVYLVVTIPLAYAGLGVWCFVWGTLVSRIVNVVAVNGLSPWIPRFSLDARSARAMLSFGLPYQLNGLVNTARESFIPTFVAFAAGAAAVGYVNWALNLALMSLFLIPIVSRVSFPAFARLQHDPAALKGAIERSIKWVAATVFPATLMLAALAPFIVKHVYLSKWRPGLPSFYLLCIPMLNAAYSTVMVSALYGLGRAKAVLRLTTTWAIAVWALGVPLTLWLGMHGLAASMSIVSMLSFMSVRELNKVVRVSFVPALLRLLVLSAIPATAVAVLAPLVVHSVVSLAVLALCGGLGYLALLFVTGELVEVRWALKVAFGHA
jgi:PST family polysaccharide transporter